LYFKFLERDGNRGPWPASVILIGLDWIGLNGNWTFRPFVSSPPGRFATWTVRPQDVSPPGRFATMQWTIRPLDWRIIFVNNTNDFVAIANIYTIT